MGDAVDFRPRGHDDLVDPQELDGARVVFLDISPQNEELVELAEVAAQVVVLDHHISARDRLEPDPDVRRALEGRGHILHFDLDHSGAVLAWQHFAREEPVPDLLNYVEDQDLWNWKLPRSQEVNAAIGSHPLRFEVWDELASRSVDDLAQEGATLVRANRNEVERQLHNAATLVLGTRRIEAVNATTNRSALGHELAKRAAFGEPWGCVYRLIGDRVTATLYSIGDTDVATVASGYGGGGHRNAAGFSVSLRDWLGMLL